MTCIVGLEVKNGVMMGCDSVSVSVEYHTIEKTRLKKVFIVQDKFLIGYTTSFRMGQILQYDLSIPKQAKKQSGLEYLSTTFIDAVRDCLKKGGFKTVSNEVETGGTFLVGYKNRLYTVQDDFSVISNTDGYAAVGSGASYALGKLWGNDHKPKKRIIEALKAAAHFNITVCNPYYVLRVGWS